MSLPEVLTREVISTEDGLLALRDDWTAAAEKAQVPNVFLTWEWAWTWWHHFGEPGALHVVVFRDSAGVCAIAPLHVSSVGVGLFRAGCLERLHAEAGDYGGVIVVRRSGDVAKALAEHAAEQLRSSRIAAVSLSRFASDDPFVEEWRAATGRCSSRMVTEESRLDGGCLFTDVRDESFKLSKLTKKHKIRQRLRRINEDYEQVEFVYHTGEALDEGLDQLLEVHRRRWADREGELQGLLAEPEREAFMLDAIRALDEQGWVRLLTLDADGRPAAAELDFEFGGRIFMFKGAFDPEFGSYSPGQLLHHRVFEDRMADGVSIFDFGRGDQDYKQRWATGERHLLTTTSVRRGFLGKVSALRLRLCRFVAVRWH